MGELINQESSGVVGIFHSRNGELVVPQPFERDIFLFDTYVAGTTYIEGLEELEPYLNNEDKLDLFR